MKQSILFEQGKLYVVELPEKEFNDNKEPAFGYEEQMIQLRKLHDVCYDKLHKAAFANKVEVKNPELIIRKGELFPDKWFLKQPLTVDDYLKILKDGDTFSLPANITFDKETGMLKRIEPEIQNYICLNCKEIYKNNPRSCNCGSKSFHKTYTQIEPETLIRGSNVFSGLIDNMKDIPNDIQKVINEGFSELLESEKPEETQEDLYQYIDNKIADDWTAKTYFERVLNVIKSEFTIQRKKS